MSVRFALVPLLGLTLLASSVNTLARDSDANAILHDKQFFTHWSASGALDTLEKAHEAKNAVNEQTRRIDKALAEETKQCYDKFFVNSCIEDARRASYERQREIRQINNEAERIIRADKTRQIQERRAAAAAEEKTPPMKPNPNAAKPQDAQRTPSSSPSPKSVREPSKPVSVAPKQVREPSKPIDIKPKSVKAPSQASVSENKAIERTEKERQNVALKKSEEAKNQEEYAEKQNELKERLANAKKVAEEKKAKRLAQKEDFEKSSRERQEAQERLKASQGSSNSSLSKFF